MAYIDGFVAAVPTANKQRYIEHVQMAAAVFREYGALKSVECWGDDVPDGKLTSFPMAVKCRDDETVERVDPALNPMPFDGERLIYGGFEMIVDS